MGMTTEIPSLTGALADHERRIRDLEFQLGTKAAVTVERREPETPQREEQH